MTDTEKQKIRKDWELEFDEYLSKYEHEWCCAHNESLYCHLDDEIENTENVVPYIKDFISKTIKSKLEAVEGEILEFREATRNDGYGQYVATIDECIDIINKHK
jgi:hypothetical protein